MIVQFVICFCVNELYERNRSFPVSHSSTPCTPSGADSDVRIPFRECLPLALGLFLFWVVLSGRLDPFHLGAGVIASLATAAFTIELLSLDPPMGPKGRHPFATLPFLRLALYLPWLVVQIGIGSVQVAKVVLSPSMNIDPRVFRFETSLPHNLARATLANSITLTPGTVTLDLRGDEYLVHALTAGSAEGLATDEPGNMKERVAHVFAGEGQEAS